MYIYLLLYPRPEGGGYIGLVSLYIPAPKGGIYRISESLYPRPEGGGYIGLVSLLGVSLQLTLPSGCFVRYLRPQ